MKIQAQLSKDGKYIKHNDIIFKKRRLIGKFWGHGYDKNLRCKKYRLWIKWGDAPCYKCDFDD